MKVDVSGFSFYRQVSEAGVGSTYDISASSFPRLASPSGVGASRSILRSRRVADVNTHEENGNKSKSLLLRLEGEREARARARANARSHEHIFIYIHACHYDLVTLSTLRTMRRPCYFMILLSRNVRHNRRNDRSTEYDFYLGPTDLRIRTQKNAGKFHAIAS